jgi:hypothetical protein
VIQKDTGSPFYYLTMVLCPLTNLSPSSVCPPLPFPVSSNHHFSLTSEIDFYRFCLWWEHGACDLCACHISLKAVSSSPVHIAACDRIPLFHDCIVLHMYTYHIFLIHSSVNGHQGYFNFLVIVTSTVKVECPCFFSILMSQIFIVALPFAS